MLLGKDTTQMDSFGIVKEQKVVKSSIDNLRKRKRDEMEVDRAEGVVEGTFRYKYFQGHTKNIKRQVPFSFFL